MAGRLVAVAKQLSMGPCDTFSPVANEADTAGSTLFRAFKRRAGKEMREIDDKVWLSDLIPIRDIEAITGRKPKILA